MKLSHTAAMFLAFLLLFCTSCTTHEPDQQPNSENPATHEELFDKIIQNWQNGSAADNYAYASDSLKATLGETEFAGLFENISKVFGNLQFVGEKESQTESGTETIRAEAVFDHAKVALTLSFQDMKLSGFFRDIRFTDTFEIQKSDGITEQYFLLQNGEYQLNAVYTYVNDGNPHPAALLIPGSGPCDYNETVGILTPFADIALGLAQNGINSLRIEKRTLRYADSFQNTGGIEAEYLDDGAAALDFLKQQPQTQSVWLFGHSLGGQIATELAANDPDVRGMILFNSTARHLADVAADQYAAADPANETLYQNYAKAAKAASLQNAKGLFYYGLSDFYWAEYNSLDCIGNIEDAKLPTLIVNGDGDTQLFREDFDCWNSQLSGRKNITIQTWNEVNHFGYLFDQTDETLLYKQTDFPEELIRLFSDFFRQ